MRKALRKYMAAIEPLCHLVGLSPSKLSKEENMILEVELFTRICEELERLTKVKYKQYLKSLKGEHETENSMTENMFVRCVINDILNTEEYTLDGIACYTYTPEDVLQELAIGQNTKPSADLLRKLVELHRSVRRDLYDAMKEKIASLIFTSE
jgi:hypothetical protein